MKTIEFYKDGKSLGMTKIHDLNMGGDRHDCAKQLNISSYDQFRLTQDNEVYFDSNEMPDYVTEELAQQIKDEINNYVQK